MTRTHASTCSSLILMTAISLSLAGCSSDKQGRAATSDDDASGAATNSAEESASTASTITISNATPATANGEFHLGAVGHVPSIGDATMYQATGRSGSMESSVILTFNAAGVLETVLWSRSSDDGAVKVSVQCDNDKGTQAPCSAEHIKADAKTGAVTFDGLVLKGMDQNGEAASATISGSIR